MSSTSSSVESKVAQESITLQLISESKVVSEISIKGEATMTFEGWGVVVVFTPPQITSPMSYIVDLETKENRQFVLSGSRTIKMGGVRRSDVTKIIVKINIKCVDGKVVMSATKEL